MSLCAHARDTRASLAGTIPNVTILWGSWHWAVSGPIGPNLPVFHYPESRSNPVSTFTQTERRLPEGGSRLSLSLLSPHRVGERRKRTWESLRFLSRFADRGPERARARQHKEVCKRKRKNRNLWTRLSERCPPSWSRLTTGVDQRNFAITLLPSSLFPIYLSIYLSRSLSLFFFYRSLSPPLSFPYLLVLSR